MKIATLICNVKKHTCRVVISEWGDPYFPGDVPPMESLVRGYYIPARGVLRENHLVDQIKDEDQDEEAQERPWAHPESEKEEERQKGQDAMSGKSHGSERASKEHGEYGNAS